MKLFKNLFDKAKNIPEVQEEVPDFNTICKIPQIASIFPWVLNNDSRIARDAAQAIAQVLHSQPSFKNKSVYNSLKHIQIGKRELSKFSEFNSDIQNSLYCIASMNHNGYVREKALTFLMQSPNLLTFPYILFRLGDWVPVLRQKAEKGLKHELTKPRLGFLIQYHKIIDWF